MEEGPGEPGAGAVILPLLCVLGQVRVLKQQIQAPPFHVNSRETRIFLSMYPMQYSGHAFTKKLFIVSVKFKLNRVSCILSVPRLAET